jgi:hypothetical protein
MSDRVKVILAGVEEVQFGSCPSRSAGMKKKKNK